MTYDEFMQLGLKVGDTIEIHDRNAISEKCYRLVTLKPPPPGHYDNHSLFSPTRLVSDRQSCFAGDYRTSSKGEPYPEELHRTGCFAFEDTVFIEHVPDPSQHPLPSWVTKAVIPA